jgi:hypothetical protein
MVWEHSGGCSENYTKQTGTRYGHYKKFLNVEEGGRYTVYQGLTREG